MTVRSRFFCCWGPFFADLTAAGDIITGPSFVEEYLSTDLLGDHGRRRRVILRDIDSGVFMLALEYMYALLTPVGLSTTRVAELLLATNSIGLEPLKSWCETTLADRMKYDLSLGAPELLRVAKSIGAGALEAACVQEIADRCGGV